MQMPMPMNMQGMGFQYPNMMASGDFMQPPSTPPAHMMNVKSSE